MAVTAKTNDSKGKILDQRITDLNTLISSAPAGSYQLMNLQRELAVAQTNAVEYYMDSGRILPGTILTTLSTSAAKIGASFGNDFTDDGKLGVMGTNLVSDTAGLTTGAATAGFQQGYSQRLLLQKQAETVRALLAYGSITAAQILSTLS